MLVKIVIGAVALCVLAVAVAGSCSILHVAAGNNPFHALNPVCSKFEWVGPLVDSFTKRV